MKPEDNVYNMTGDNNYYIISQHNVACTSGARQLSLSKQLYEQPLLGNNSVSNSHLLGN
jgi:hypothetical protein